MAAGKGFVGKDFDILKDGGRLLSMLGRETSPISHERQASQSHLAGGAFDLEAAAIALLKLIDQIPQEDFMFTDKVVSLASGTGRTVLHFSASLGFERFLQVLLMCGVDPDYPDNIGYTALHFAALYGHIGCTRLLLREGADASAINAEGCTALELGMDSNHRTVVEFLKTHMAIEADVDDFGGEQGDKDDHVSHARILVVPGLNDSYISDVPPGSNQNDIRAK
jgi:hypothetical protein